MTTLNHSIPLALTLVDYFLNRITFVIFQFIFPIGLIILYVLGILMPYTLENEPIYSGITFEDAFSYILCLGIIVLLGVTLYLTRLIHICMSKHNDLKTSFL